LSFGEDFGFDLPAGLLVEVVVRLRAGDLLDVFFRVEDLGDRFGMPWWFSFFSLILKILRVPDVLMMGCAPSGSAGTTSS